MVKTDATLKQFVPGRGYTKAEWDELDIPEITDEQWKNFRPASEVLPPELYNALVEMQRERQRGRPPAEAAKDRQGR